MARLGPYTVLQNAATATGNGTALSLAGKTYAVVQVSGTFSATITWEMTVDGANWSAIAPADLGSTTRARELTTTVPKTVLFDALGGVSAIRARISAYTSGSVTAAGVASE